MKKNEKVAPIDLSKLPEQYQAKIKVIEQLFKGKRIIVAFSGGIDSSLVCLFAKLYGSAVQAVIIESPMTPQQELKQAELFSKVLHIPLEKLQINTLANPNIVKNTSDRCYFCKKDILINLEHFRKKLEYDLLVDGTNYSDLSLIRAGLKALKESTTLSPLAIAKITKDEIIDISCILNLPSAHIPSQACLASRIPFEISLTAPLLKMIDAAEQQIRAIIDDKTSSIRVRIHPVGKEDKFLARIEAGDDFWQKLSDPYKRNQIEDALNKIGFIFVTLDVAGFHSGSMNKLLKN